MKGIAYYPWAQDTFLVDYGFSRCHILVAEDNPYVWSFSMNPLSAYKAPCHSYLKGAGVLFYTQNPPNPPAAFPNNDKWICSPPFGYDCRIKNNIYKNNCYSGCGLK